MRYGRGLGDEGGAAITTHGGTTHLQRERRAELAAHVEQEDGAVVVEQHVREHGVAVDHVTVREALLARVRLELGGDLLIHLAGL